MVIMENYRKILQKITWKACISRVLSFNELLIGTKSKTRAVIHIPNKSDKLSIRLFSLLIQN